MTLVAALALGALSCKSLPEAQQARVDRFDCEVAAIAPLVDGVLDAEAFVRNVYEGAATYAQLAPLLKLTMAEVQAASERLQACRVEAPAGLPEVPEGDPN